jgi:hypothetical protein
MLVIFMHCVIRCSFFIIAVVGVLASPAQAQSPTAPNACYELKLDSWSGPFPSGWPAVHQPPDTVYLHPDYAKTFGGRGQSPRASPHLAVVRKGSMVDPIWETPTPDSLIVIWSTGFAGVRVHLELKGDSAIGVAHAFHDVEGTGIVQPHAAARAKRITCIERSH